MISALFRAAALLTLFAGGALMFAAFTVACVAGAVFAPLGSLILSAVTALGRAMKRRPLLLTDEVTP